MSTCNLCADRLRQDETLAQVFVEGQGALWACPRCVCRQFGYPPPAVRVYPWGPEHRPPPPGVEVCGLCRLALYQGERGQPIRLSPDDVAGTEVEEGAYLICGDCLALWRPRVHRRMVAAGRIHPDLPETALGGTMLL